MENSSCNHADEYAKWMTKLAAWSRLDGYARRRDFGLCLFGSAVCSKEPRDIDVMVVCDSAIMSREDPKGIVRQLRTTWASRARRRVHIVVFNRREERSGRFVRQFGAVPIDQPANNCVNRSGESGDI